MNEAGTLVLLIRLKVLLIITYCSEVGRKTCNFFWKLLLTRQVIILFSLMLLSSSGNICKIFLLYLHKWPVFNQHSAVVILGQSLLDSLSELLSPSSQSRREAPSQCGKLKLAIRLLSTMVMMTMIGRLMQITSTTWQKRSKDMAQNGTSVLLSKSKNFPKCETDSSVVLIHQKLPTFYWIFLHSKQQ